MPSEKILQAKKEKVKVLAEKMQGAASVVLVDYKGISVSTDTSLRAEMRENGVTYMVEKNSILSHVFDATGLTALKDDLKGTVAIAFSADDAVAPARVLQKYADKSKDIFNLKSGIVDGKIVNAAELKGIAMLPDRNTLIAMVCGALNGTISGLARALSEVVKQKAE
mgnify:CR=1 FL=1